MDTSFRCAAAKTFVLTGICVLKVEYEVARCDFHLFVDCGLLWGSRGRKLAMLPTREMIGALPTIIQNIYANDWLLLQQGRALLERPDCTRLFA